MASEYPTFQPLVVHSRGQIVEALRNRRHQLGLTCEGLDNHAGFSDRYTTKLENPTSPSGKLGFHFDFSSVEVGPAGNIRCTAMAEIWLEALGLRLVLVDYATACAIGAAPAPPPSPREHVARTGGDAAPGHALARAARGARSSQPLTQHVAADRAASAADAVRATVTAWDAARKRSFRFEFMGALHDRRGLTIADLRKGDDEDKAFASWLGARGFSEGDWATIRTAPVWEPADGAKFLRPTDVADETLGLRLAEAIDMETRVAVPQTTLWTRAKLLGETRPGTVAGEARRSWAMFRSFSLTATHMLGEELMLRGQAGGQAPFVAGAAGAAGVLFFLTLGGAVAIQMRELSQGKDPRPMDNHKFWMAAALQGGGLGILGDFFYAAEARNGKSATQVAAFGPVGGAVGDAWGLTGGNVAQIADGMSEGEDLGEAVEGARIGRDAVDFARRYTPGGNIWFLRTAYNRLVLDNLQRIVDPEAEEDFARSRKRLERDRGQGQFWAEGENAPSRAPELETALGGDE